MGLILIERYIFKKALIAFLTAGGGLIGVLWVVRAVQNIDVILNKGQSIAVYLKMTSLGVPTLAAAIAPLALMIGLVRTINALNDDTELVVMHASGASRVSLMKPFLVLSLLVTALVYFLHLWAGPTSMQVLRTFVTKVRADLVSVIVREGTFQDVGKGLTFHIAAREPGGVLKGVFILDGRNNKETFTYLANEGTISKVDEQSYLVLKNGQIQRLNHEDNALSVIKFNSYAFNLSSFSGGKTATGRSQMEVSTYNLIFPDSNDPLFKHKPGRFRAELHTRLTGGLHPLMVGLLLLAYLGNPSSHRQGQSVVITTVTMLIILLRGITIVAEGSLRDDPNMIAVVWGIPLITIAIALFLLLTDRSGFPPELLAKVETVLHNLMTKLEPLRAKLRGYKLDGQVRS
ncbi:MAG: LPS export ABC transporter permease LptF [Rhizobiaceae bacterium]